MYSLVTQGEEAKEREKGNWMCFIHVGFKNWNVYKT